MKKLVIILTTALLFTVFTPEAHAENKKINFNEVTTSKPLISLLIEMKKAEQLKIENEKYFFFLKIQKEKIANKIEELHTHVGKTHYVFSGSTPAGWDCSGLVLWFYSDFNIELPHSASKQMFYGTFVDEPAPGDIVSFTRSNNQRAYHNGIYIGDGKMIHSPKPGKRTEVRQITDLENMEKVVYTRILESGKID
jgi:cell wall-associated NlpC family hydrolase